MTYPALSTSSHVDKFDGRDSSRRFIMPITLAIDVCPGGKLNCTGCL